MSRPRELEALYPAAPRDAILKHLNSGLYIGPPDSIISFLEVAAGLEHNQTTLESLHRHYKHWEQLKDGSAIPPIFAPGTNAQIRYAGMYVAQRWRAACSADAPEPAQDGGRRCYRSWHDQVERCTPVRCEAGAYTPSAPLVLDHNLVLFDNMYHGGARKLVGHRLVHASSGAQPAAVQFNGPSKVVFENSWRLPWGKRGDTGTTPSECLALEMFAGGLDATELRAAGGSVRQWLKRSFASNVVVYDRRFQRTSPFDTERGGQGLSYLCDLFGGGFAGVVLPSPDDIC